MEDLNVDSLRVDCLLSKPRDQDWSEGYGETWEVVHPFDEDSFDNADCPDCDGIGEVLHSLDGNRTVWGKCEKCEGTGEIDLTNEEKTGYYDFDDMQISNVPMMNYLYPLYHMDSFDADDAKKINHLPLCIVYFTESEEYGLALTGGGMDLSWQICEAHIRLGYYPPVHFRLPRMAGKEASPRNLAIVDACVKAREIVGGWQSSDMKDLERTREYLREVQS